MHIKKSSFFPTPPTSFLLHRPFLINIESRSVLINKRRTLVKILGHIRLKYQWEFLPWFQLFFGNDTRARELVNNCVKSAWLISSPVDFHPRTSCAGAFFCRFTKHRMQINGSNPNGYEPSRNKRNSDLFLDFVFRNPFSKTINTHIRDPIICSYYSDSTIVSSRSVPRYLYF